MNTKKRFSPGLLGCGFRAKQTSKGSLVKDLLSFKCWIFLSCAISVDSEVKCQFPDIVAVINVFLLTDKAANGPASKKSKNENKKGKTAASVNENVSLSFLEFRCFPLYLPIRRYQVAIASNFNCLLVLVKNSITANHAKSTPYSRASGPFNNLTLSILNI